MKRTSDSEKSMREDKKNGVMRRKDEEGNNRSNIRGEWTSRGVTRKPEEDKNRTDEHSKEDIRRTRGCYGRTPRGTEGRRR